jgi:hypothetical protein
LELGYGIEADVRLIDDKFFLGHDGPQYEVAEKFFDETDRSKVWYRAKTLRRWNTWFREKT